MTDDDPEFYIRDDPSEEPPENAARFELMYPNVEKYPDSKTVMVRITFEGMQIASTFPVDRAERFQDLLRVYDRVVPKLLEAREREVTIRKEAGNLDDDLASLFDEEVEE